MFVYVTNCGLINITVAVDSVLDASGNNQPKGPQHTAINDLLSMEEAEG